LGVSAIQKYTALNIPKAVAATKKYKAVVLRRGFHPHFLMTNAPRIRVWNEYQQEKTAPEVAKLYPNGLYFRKFTAFLFGTLSYASQGAIIVLAITLSATAASTSTEILHQSQVSLSWGRQDAYATRKIIDGGMGGTPVLVYGARAESTLLPITEDSTLRNGATVKPTLVVSQHLPTGHHLPLAQDDVRAVETRTQRILFKRGAVSTVVEGSVRRGSRTIYLLRARGDQTMTLSLTSLEQNAVFDVQAPDGQYLEQEATSFRGELPRTGDYSVIIHGTRGNANYRLEVRIR
jgi:hypothetical protein